MFSLPQHYLVSARAQAGIQTTWSAAGRDGREIACAIPEDFGGPGGGFSPEEIYALALANCFVATFKVIAERSRLDFEALDVQADLTVDKNEAGHPWMAAIHLDVTISGVSDADKATRLLEKATQACLILNSVKTVKTFTFHVR